MQVEKRNGEYQDMDIAKIKEAIIKASYAVGEALDSSDLMQIMKHIELRDKMSVEQIQDQVEVALMAEKKFRAAKAFMLYRQQHAEDRELDERIEYMDKYSQTSDNAATASETDANANITIKNVSNMEGEVYKMKNRRIQRRKMKKMLTKLYGTELADQYIKDIEHHIIYIHDEASTPTDKNYCEAVSLYPLMVDGTSTLDGLQTEAPHNLNSACGQLVNCAFLLSSQCKGACLYKDQPLFINGKQNIKIKDLWLDKSHNKTINTFTHENDTWEYVNTTDLNVFEDGKNVAVTKVYRRPYKDDIYTIKSSKGLLAKTSKDHLFKVLRGGQIESVKASELRLYDTVFVNNEKNEVVDFNSDDFKLGWLHGMICGDGCISCPPIVSLAVNYQQEYFGTIFNEYSEHLFGETLSKCAGHSCYNYERRIISYYNDITKGIVGTGTFSKTIEDYQNKSYEYLCGFLDGILSADGGQNHSFVLSLTNKSIISVVQYILDMLNVSYSYKEIEEHDNKSRLYNLCISSTVTRYTPNTSLKLKKPNNNKELYFFSGIARKNNRKNPNYICSVKRDHFVHSDYKLDVITDISSFMNDDDYVYEIETSTHWYNCGGFITHNCAFGEFFNYLNYYIVKEFGSNWYNKLDCSATTEHCLKKRTIKDTIEQAFQYVVFNLNQPAGNRGSQSPFTNISYYDSNYWKAMFEDFYYPDGTQPEWPAIDALQKLFMKWFNKTRSKTLLTFPVETMAMLTKDGDVIDQDYKNFTAEMYHEGHSFFTYLSDNPDNLASCCFSKDTKVIWKSSTLGANISTLEEVHNMNWEPGKKDLCFFHNGSWILGKTIKLSCRPMYKVTTWNNKEFTMTDNHINVTLNGEVQTKDLNVGDYLLFNNSCLKAVKENDKKLTYEQGMLIGMFLGNGSLGSRVNDVIYEVNFSQNGTNCLPCLKIVDKVAEQLNISTRGAIGEPKNNVFPVRISSKQLVDFVKEWTNWEEGKCCSNKEVNMNALLQSESFRRGILDGWYSTDGGNSNRCYTTSEKLKDCMEAIITSLGLNSIIDVSDRTDEKVIIRGQEFNRNFPLWCVRWYEEGNHRANKDSNKSWVKHNNSIYFKIKSIEKVEYSDSVYCIECKNQDEPYFTLPSGLITHNCRLRNEVTDNEFSFTNGLTGVQTGSCNVITLNLNRIIQDYVNVSGHEAVSGVKLSAPMMEGFKEYLIGILGRIYKYHIAFKTRLYEAEKNGMLTASKAGYIKMNKLFSTIGLNGINEAAEFVGLTCDYNEDYKEFCRLITGTISEQNKLNSTKDFKFNTEFVPAEGLSSKNYNWDKEEGYWVPESRNLYNSYFYIAHDDTSVLDKFKLHGEEFTGLMDGGVGLHCNLSEHLSKAQYIKLIDFAIERGTSYFTFNVPNTQCDECGHIEKLPMTKCPKCGSEHVTQWTRVIGFLRPIKCFDKYRFAEAQKRTYTGKEEAC